MILINLLPHREARRALRKRTFLLGLGLAAVVGGALAVGWYAVLDQMTSAQQARNAYLKSEIAKLDAQIKDIADLRAEIDALKARQQAVEGLQANRNVPVYLLDELAKQTPEGVYLTNVRQADRLVTVTGVAQTNERVSELLRNTAYGSEWLERPELVEIKATTVTLANKEQRRLFDFSMRVSLKLPVGPAEGASAPDAAASGAARPAPRAASAAATKTP